MEPAKLDALLLRIRLAVEAEVLPLVREVEGLRSRLQQLACLGNGDRWGNSDGNRIAQSALGGKEALPPIASGHIGCADDGIPDRRTTDPDEELRKRQAARETNDA